MKARQSLGLVMALIMVLTMSTNVFGQSETEMTPDVRISPTGIVDGKVIIARAVADGPAWIVIHADDEGAPGEVIGYAPLEEGENTNVAVEIDADAATPILHAMLHDDQGEVGTYEFPGPDTPTQLDGNIVMAAFSAQPVPADTAPMPPDIEIGPNGVVDGKIVIARATATDPSWVVIHADDDGAPGEVIGFAPLNPGENNDVIVEIDTEAATSTLHAMLHDDNGEVGVYEFPGPDTPTEIDGNIVMAEFSSAGTPDTAGDAKGAASPGMMPETGSAMPTGMIFIVVLGLLALLAGSTWLRARRQTDSSLR